MNGSSWKGFRVLVNPVEYIKEKKYVAVCWNIFSFSHKADQLWLSGLDFISCHFLVVISSHWKIFKMLFLSLEQTYLIFVIFFTQSKFLENQIYTKKCVNYDKLHSKMPIFCVKSEKIYTGQKKFTRVPPVAPVTNMRYG